MSAPTHPALQPYLARLNPARSSSSGERLALLNDWAREQSLRNGFGQPIRFAAASGALQAVDYEWRIGGEAGQHEGVIDTRDEGSGGDHDLLNAMAWLHFPHSKAWLNRCHVEEILKLPEASDSRVRSPARDRLTLFDENGAVLLTQDEELIEWLATRQWQRLFLDERERLLAKARLIIFGHGLLQKCLRPFPSMTARVQVLRLAPTDHLAQVDEALSEALRKAWPAMNTLVMPICGWPGWQAGDAGELQDQGFYGDRAVFRV